MNPMNAMVARDQMGTMTGNGPMGMMAGSGPMNGTPHTIELDEALLQQLGWTGFWGDIQDRLQSELNRTRKVRHLLPLWADASLDPDAIPDYTTQDGSPGSAIASPEPFSIPSQPRLVSVEISSEFQISPIQFGDLGAAMRLVSRAANRLALAEDAVLLYGNSLVDRDAREWTDLSRQIGFPGLRIHFENLERQDKFLYQRPADPAVERHEMRQKHLILESILQGIKELQEQRASASSRGRSRPEGHFGEYCVIVAPDLYEAAFRPRSIRSTDALARPTGRSIDRDDLTDAPIYQIRPLLREGGFAYSQMALSGTGAIFSLGGASIYLAVPEEAHLAFVRISRDVVLCVQERIRLLINEDTACQRLRDPEETERGPSESEQIRQIVEQERQERSQMQQEIGQAIERERRERVRMQRDLGLLKDVLPDFRTALEAFRESLQTQPQPASPVTEEKPPTTP